ncbi:hypothetical protein NYO91_16590 [Arhodomonas aquaeolei]|uniref:glycerophosphodiester phosphodiesterase family protein n=1 Tax=Arhodomonas aquaeolei TaxID=2369 RepID=UPI00216933AD|nr:glycerophosphodiester phosphodiesterase family protein [Arhodomonas aquaeolei]MCS4505704.1 hypothetical protein [Arhodomonas aquaeolei]
MFGTRVFAHRGASLAAPENTLPAIELAAALGVGWVELDVQLLGDGTPVIFHDERLDRCTDGAGRIADADWVAVAALDAGGWFSPRYAGTRMPRLEQALALCRQRGLGLNLELKPTGEKGRRTALAATVLDSLQTTGFPREALLLSSFDVPVLAECRRRDPGIRLGLICERVPERAGAVLQAFGGVSLHVDWRHLDPAGVRRLCAAGIAVVAWTANRPEAVDPLWSAGLTAVITDDPNAYFVRGIR